MKLQQPILFFAFILLPVGCLSPRITTVPEMQAYLNSKGIRYYSLERVADGRRILDLIGTPIKSLRPLSPLDLDFLRADESTDVKDLRPLRHMPLTGLDVSRTGVKDLRPLTRLPLTELYLWYTPVEDLTPLKGLKLNYLMAGGTDVSDLEPLRGMPLRKLDVNSTAVRDLSPLEGMPIVVLLIYNTPVTDVTIVQTMPDLEELFFSPETVTKGVEALRSKKSIRYLGAKRYKDHFLTADEFWKLFDADPAMKATRNAEQAPAGDHLETPSKR